MTYHLRMTRVGALNALHHGGNIIPDPGVALSRRFHATTPARISVGVHVRHPNIK